MRRGKRSNILLLELLLVIFFFMIGAVVLVQVFGKVGALSRQARLQEQALIYCQSLSDRLYRTGEAGEMLAAEGYAHTQEAVWSAPQAGYTVRVVLDEETSESGLSYWSISAEEPDGEVFLTLPGARAERPVR